MAARTLSPAGPLADISASISYQAPASALANFCPAPSGRSSTSVRTTVRSRISPGICDELKSEVMPFCLTICDTIGFQVTTAEALVSLMKAVAMSESEVLISRTFLICSRSRCKVMARSNRYSETVFCTSSIFLPARSFSCRPFRTSSASLPLE